MSTVQTSPPDSDPRRGLPRWAWVLIALLAIIALVAVAMAVFGRQGRTVVLPPAPAASPATTSPAAPSASSTSPPASGTLADGCLGGVLELDQAVLTAQGQAPLTPAGAASFTATLMRWAFAGPPPAQQAVTAQQVLTGDATPAARRSLSGSKDFQGSAGTLNFNSGKYYVESFNGRTAVVSYLASAAPTVNGVPQGSVLLSGAVQLQAVNGTWHYHDLTGNRSIEDLQGVGVPYSGGC